MFNSLSFSSETQGMSYQPRGQKVYAQFSIVDSFAELEKKIAYINSFPAKRLAMREEASSLEIF